MTEDHDDDHGPFGRPLFDDPSARALSRVGVVDVGSNSVRMVVFDGAARSPAYFYNEKLMCGLGKGLAETGRLNPEGRAGNRFATAQQAWRDPLSLTKPPDAPRRGFFRSIGHSSPGLHCDGPWGTAGMFGAEWSARSSLTSDLRQHASGLF